MKTGALILASQEPEEIDRGNEELSLFLPMYPLDGTTGDRCPAQGWHLPHRRADRLPERNPQKPFKPQQCALHR